MRLTIKGGLHCLIFYFIILTCKAYYICKQPGEQRGNCPPKFSKTSWKRK